MHRHRLFVAGAFMTVASLTATAQTPTAVHVFTARDPSGLVDKSTAERIKAVDDIAKRLSRNKAITLVDSPSAALVVLEVTSAGTEDLGRKSVSTVVGAGNTAIVSPGVSLPDFVGRAMVRSGTFSTELTSSIGPFGRSYGENLARKFEDWFKENGAALAAASKAK